MEGLDKIFKKEKTGELVLSLLFIIYIIFGYKTPALLAKAIDNIFGKVIVVIIAILLFAKCHPILGVLGFIVAYVLIKRSEIKTGTYGIENYMPTEEKKASNLSFYNQFPYTLEEEMVSKMAPIEHTVSGKPSYSPVLENNHDASPILV